MTALPAAAYLIDGPVAVEQTTTALAGVSAR